nr:DUF3037 domain-containing protein [uncultured Psychroserpens sp.]
MQDKVTFEYAIIRLVPKVEREEFFNVGVILFSKRKKFLGIKYNIDSIKLNAFTNELDITHLNEYLNAWKLICEGHPNGGAIGQFELSDRFRWLAASKSTMIQCSKTHPGLCDDAQKALDTIFKNYVL